MEHRLKSHEVTLTGWGATIICYGESADQIPVSVHQLQNIENKILWHDLRSENVD